MPKSTTSAAALKPYPDYPLTPHPSGRWCKRIKGTLHFFGRWGRTVNGKVVRVENFDEEAIKAADVYQDQREDLYAGRTPRTENADGLTVLDLVNQYLTYQRGRLSGRGKKLSPHSFAADYQVCDLLLKHVNKRRRVNDLSPDDFGDIRAALAQEVNDTTLDGRINRIRGMLRWGVTNKKINEPDYGTMFDRVEEDDLEIVQEENADTMFEPEELRLILDALDGKTVQVDGEDVTLNTDPVLRAMVLLSINTAFGNTDVASVPISAFDLEDGWIQFRRPKTKVMRHVPLWEETVAGINKALEHRPEPKDPEDTDLIFLTSRGTRWVRIQPSKKNPDRFVTINALSRRFEKLLKSLGINGRRRLGYYTLRAVVETIGGECGDQIAVDQIMGHKPPKKDRIPARYRKRQRGHRATVSDERLMRVTERVRQWLFREGVRDAK